LRYAVLDQAAATVREAHLAAWRAWTDGLAQAGKFEDGYPLAADGRKSAPTALKPMISQKKAPEVSWC